MNTIRTTRTIELSKSVLDEVSEAELNAAAARLGKGVQHRIESMVKGALGSAATTNSLPGPGLTQEDLLSIIRSIPPVPRRIFGVTTRPDATAGVKAALNSQRECSHSAIFPLQGFKVVELERQAEPIRVFYNCAEFLRHIAVMSLEVGDIVVNINPGFWLRAGCESYDDAVVASLDPFVLVSRGGDMRWSATILPEWFQRMSRADEATLKRVLARLEHDMAEGRL